MRILECSSAGDKRFSAFYARVKFLGVTDTIENHYQKVKRNKLGLPCRKGERVEYIELCNNKYKPEMLTPLYRYLWYKYLEENPKLVEYAKQFDVFNDKFRGKCINCQADCINAYVNKDKEPTKFNLFFSCAQEIAQYDI
ncbi:MAG: hypothetical protein J6J33_04295 [Clostridia bacterium]|nr:hypothetical protein [Clostridia bacterium]